MFTNVASKKAMSLAKRDTAERNVTKHLGPRDPKSFLPHPPPALPPLGMSGNVSVVITCATAKADTHPNPQADNPKCLCGDKAHDGENENRAVCAPGSHLVPNKAGITLTEKFVALPKKLIWSDDPAIGQIKLMSCYSVGGLLRSSPIV